MAAQLAAAGHEVLVLDLPRQVSSPDDVLTGFLANLPVDHRRVVLVAHSNAGLYLPAVAQSREVEALVFVDAALPPVIGGCAPTADASFQAFLAPKVDGQGLLPPWSQWWQEDLSSLFPDDRSRQEVEAEQRRLPLSYFQATVPVPEGWDARPCAYVAFGDTYAAELSAARQRGWPVRALDGQHLEMLLRPDVVAAEILELPVIGGQPR